MPSLPDLKSVGTADPSEHILMECYSLMFPEPVSLELQQLQTPEVVAGGFSALKDQGVMNELQWVVFCTSHLTGGIANGGVWDGLLGNQPQLVADCVPLLKLLGLESAADRFGRLFGPVFELQDRVRQELKMGETVNMEQYWEDLQAAEELLIEDDVEVLVEDFLGEFGSSEPTLKSKVEDAAVSYLISNSR